MATTLTTLKERVYTRLRAENASPSVNNIHVDSIERWANEKLSTVIEYLRPKPEHLQQLRVVDQTVAISSGSGSLPADFAFPLAVRVGSDLVRAILMDSHDQFASYDDFNFEKYFAENEELVNQALKVVDANLSFSGGQATLPTDFGMAIAVKANVGGVSKKKCILTTDPQIFAQLDSANFLTTPTNEFPFVLIADGKAYLKSALGGSITGYLDYIRKPPFAMAANGNLYVKPTSHTTSKLDYVKNHPAVSGGTKFSELGDEILVELIVAEVFGFLELPDLTAKAEAKARALAQ